MPPLFQDFIALKASSLFLVVPYVHVLGLVLAHVAVITSNNWVERKGQYYWKKLKRQ